MVCDNVKLTLVVLSVLMVFQLFKCIETEQFSGYPLYLFVLFIPLMIFGGGLEEIGWRGFLQPALEEKMPFAVATLVQGIIWAVWHLPLWFIINANQSNFDFVSFLLYCISFSFSLALLYKVSKSVIAAIVLHAWGNVVLGGMFSFNSLVSIPEIKTFLLYGIEITVVICVVTIMEKRTIHNNIKDSILIVNTLNSDIPRELLDILPNAIIENTHLKNINHCIGCNSCWVKTPGRCAIKDDYEELFVKMIAADKIIFVAEEKMGMVSYKMKNLVDRMIAVNLPYTCIKDGQARHEARYPKKWKLMLITYNCTENNYLLEWMNRVAINFHSSSMGVFHISEKEKIKDAVYNN